MRTDDHKRRGKTGQTAREKDGEDMKSSIPGGSRTRSGRRSRRLEAVLAGMALLMAFSAARVSAQSKPAPDCLLEPIAHLAVANVNDPHLRSSNLKDSNRGTGDENDTASGAMVQILQVADSAIAEAGNKGTDCQRAAANIAFQAVFDAYTGGILGGFLRAIKSALTNIFNLGKQGLEEYLGDKLKEAEDAAKEAFKEWVKEKLNGKPPEVYEKGFTKGPCTGTVTSTWDMAAGTYKVVVEGHCQCKPVPTGGLRSAQLEKFTVTVSGKVSIDLDYKEHMPILHVAPPTEVTVDAHCENCSRPQTTKKPEQPGTTPQPGTPQDGGGTTPELPRVPEMPKECNLKPPCPKCMPIYDQIVAACKRARELIDVMDKLTQEYGANGGSQRYAQLRLDQLEAQGASESQIAAQKAELTQLQQAAKNIILTGLQDGFEIQQIQAALADLAKQLDECQKPPCGPKKKVEQPPTGTTAPPVPPEKPTKPTPPETPPPGPGGVNPPQGPPVPPAPPAPPATPTSPPAESRPIVPRKPLPACWPSGTDMKIACQGWREIAQLNQLAADLALKALADAQSDLNQADRLDKSAQQWEDHAKSLDNVSKEYADLSKSDAAKVAGASTKESALQWQQFSKEADAKSKELSDQAAQTRSEAAAIRAQAKALRDKVAAEKADEAAKKAAAADSWQDYNSCMKLPQCPQAGQSVTPGGAPVTTGAPTTTSTPGTTAPATPPPSTPSVPTSAPPTPPPSTPSAPTSGPPTPQTPVNPPAPPDNKTIGAIPAPATPPATNQSGASSSGGQVPVIASNVGGLPKAETRVVDGSLLPPRDSSYFCVSNSVTVTPQLRAEGITEMVGDIVLTCTGGQPTLPLNGSQIPGLVTFQLSLDVGSPDASGGGQESLLLIDEPGTITTTDASGKLVTNQGISGQNSVAFNSSFFPAGPNGTSQFTISGLRFKLSGSPPPDGQSGITPIVLRLSGSLSGGQSIEFTDPTPGPVGPVVPARSITKTYTHIVHPPLSLAPALSGPPGYDTGLNIGATSVDPFSPSAGPAGFNPSTGIDNFTGSALYPTGSPILTAPVKQSGQKEAVDGIRIDLSSITPIYIPIPYSPSMIPIAPAGPGSSFMRPRADGSDAAIPTSGSVQLAAFHASDVNSAFLSGAVVRMVPGSPPNSQSSSGAVPQSDGAPSFNLVANGNSSGEAYEFQVFDATRSLKEIRVPDGLILEPLERGAVKPVSGAPEEKKTSAKLSAYCVDYAKDPPDPNALFRVAAPEIQEQYKPVRMVMRAGRELAAAGKFHPDSDAAAYNISIRQYAIWTRLENWNEEKFAEVFIEKTRQIAVTAKVEWTKQMEAALRALVPGRWRDISMVVEEAQRLEAASRPANPPSAPAR